MKSPVTEMFTVIVFSQEREYTFSCKMLIKYETTILQKY